jgi:hypothetical protein
MLRPEEGYIFTGLQRAMVNGQTATILFRDSDRMAVEYIFSATAQDPNESDTHDGKTIIREAGITVTPPVTGDSTIHDIKIVNGTGFSIRGITKSPNHETFVEGTEYTIVITMDVLEGYTFTGLKNTKTTINGQLVELFVNAGTYASLRYVFVASEYQEPEPEEPEPEYELKDVIKSIENIENWLFVLVILLGLILGVSIVNNMKK